MDTCHTMSQPARLARAYARAILRDRQGRTVPHVAVLGVCEDLDSEGFSHLALSTLRRAAIGAAADLGFEVTADDYIILQIADWAEQ